MASNGEADDGGGRSNNNGKDNTKNAWPQRATICDAQKKYDTKSDQCILSYARGEAQPNALDGGFSSTV